MNYRISINPLDANSVQKAIKRCEKIKKRYSNENISRFLDYVAQAGADAAQTAFGDAVHCTVESNDFQRIVKANGKAVVFLEFGAGAATNSGSEYADRMPFPVRRGSYSDARHGEYTQSGYKQWHFGGKVYTEVIPTMGMELAYSAIRQAVTDAVERWPVR